MLLPKEPTHNDSKDAVAGAAAALSLLSPPTDNTNSKHFNQSHMKCYYDCTQSCFLHYFNDLIPDDAVIYAGDIFSTTR